MGCSFRQRSLSANAISVMTKGIDDKSRDYAETMISSDIQENNLLLSIFREAPVAFNPP